MAQAGRGVVPARSGLVEVGVLWELQREDLDICLLQRTAARLPLGYSDYFLGRGRLLSGACWSLAYRHVLEHLMCETAYA